MNIIFENKTYGENDYQNTIKEYKCDWKKIKRVALVMKRSPKLLYLMYYFFKNGITFIPIDVDQPINRIEYILNNSCPDLILSDINIGSRTDYIIEKVDWNQIAYILFTTGSTGNPKGVAVTREALLNFIEGVSEIICFTPGKRIACLTTASFDIFFLESVMALLKGLTVVLSNEDEQRNPKLMAKLIADNSVDMIQITPSRMQLLLNYDKELSCLRNVSEILIGGEPFPLNLLRTLKDKTNAKIYNMYGPTEATIWSTVSNLTHKDRIDIGRPIKNTEAYIVDERLFIVPNGQVGEICIAGKGLAKGYVGNDNLTAERFVYLPQNPEVRVYRTGDIGRYLIDGSLEYLGRCDNQVKIRGRRIELEEIESHLNQIDGIKQSVVIALETSESGKMIEAFYTSDDALDQKEIINYLSAKLPEYMIPVVFKRVENFIQTQNGKIDRKRVLECVEIKSHDNLQIEYHMEKLNEVQKKVYNIILSTLDSKFGNVTLDTTFAEIGADSITFITIVVALECEFKFEFDDEMLLITAFPTIRSMIEYVELKIHNVQ